MTADKLLYWFFWAFYRFVLVIVGLQVLGYVIWVLNP